MKRIKLHLNILEGLGNYFSLTVNEYTAVLYFFLFLLLYVECSHLLPYITLVVNKPLYET